jgi:hypothetical protein
VAIKPPRAGVVPVERMTELPVAVRQTNRVFHRASPAESRRAGIAAVACSPANRAGHGGEPRGAETIARNSVPCRQGTRLNQASKFEKAAADRAVRIAGSSAARLKYGYLGQLKKSTNI